MNDKEKVVRRLEGTDIKIHQKKIANNVTNSFFYDGEIASAIAPDGTQLSLIATGEIRICMNGERIYCNGKEYNSGFGFKVEKDKELTKVTDEKGFQWENNNWFEVTFSKDGYSDSDIGEVVYDYDSGIQLLNDYLVDERFKCQIKTK